MSFQNKVKRHFRFTSSEARDYFLTTIIISLIMFFYIWRTTNFSLMTGAINIGIIFLVTLISMFLFIASAKLMAIKRGYVGEYSSWFTGLLIAFVISFVSYGLIPIFFPGLIEIKVIERLRHGNQFVGENRKDLVWVIVTTIITIVLFSVFLGILYNITSIKLFQYASLFNAFLAFFAMLPFTKNIGLHLFYVRKSKFFILLFFTLSFFLFTLSNNSLAFQISIGATIVLWIIYKKFFEKKI